MSDRKAELVSLIGEDSVFDSPEILGAYSSDMSFTPSRKPQVIIKPRNTDDVQKVVEWANQKQTPLVPVSSGPPHFHGDTIPNVEGAVVVDLSRMNRILRIDNRNRIAMIEPGVIFSQLQQALAKEGMSPSMSLMPRSNKSVVASLLEREPILTPRYSWSLPDPLRCVEVIWGSGQKLWTGDAGMRGSLERQWKSGMAQSVPMGPLQIDYYRLLSAAQGTMGIVTWATLKCEILPKARKLFLITSAELGGLLDFAYEILRLKYGDELLFLNSSNLAYIFAKDAGQVGLMKKELPQWSLILGVAGREFLPEERLEYQEKDIADIARGFGLQLATELPGVTQNELLETLINPSRDPYWKIRYKGGCQDIFFLTTLDKTPEFIEVMYQISRSEGYLPQDIGIYLQPVHHGTGCHCEFNLPYDPRDEDEITKVQKILSKGTEALIKKGAFFSRPYGIWADMVYSRDAQTVAMLQTVKKIFDPNNVMNPGKLCFKA